MYCPLCGSKMEEFEDRKSRYSKWEDGFNWSTATPKECDKHLDNEPDNDSIYLKCTGDRNCFDEGFPLIWHYPYNSHRAEKEDRFNKAPVDSWSLTWIK